MLPALAAMAVPGLIGGLTSGMSGGQGGGSNSMMNSMMMGAAFGPAGMLLAPVLNGLFGGQQQPQQPQGINDQQYNQLMDRIDDIDRDIARMDDFPHPRGPSSPLSLSLTRFCDSETRFQL